VGNSDDVGDSEGPGKLIVRVFICVDYPGIPTLPIQIFRAVAGTRESFTLRILSYHEAIHKQWRAQSKV